MPISVSTSSATLSADPSRLLRPHHRRNRSSSTRSPGSGNLRTLVGYQLVNSNIQFANSIGSINIGRGGIDPVGIGRSISTSGGEHFNNVISSGKLTSFTVNGNVQGLDLEIAGPITSINIGGSVLSPIAFDPITLTTHAMVSNFTSKGTSGNICSNTVNGSMAGNLLAEGVVGTITIGTKASRAGTDDFSGSITILENHLRPHALTLLNIFGSILGGSLSIFGNVGTINVFRSLSGLSSNLVIHGNLANITIGSDLSHNNYALTGSLTVEGSLGKATVNGALNGLLLVKGTANNVTVVSQRHGDIVSSAGGVEAEGLITNFTAIGGNVAGNIVSTSGITHVSISGGLSPVASPAPPATLPASPSPAPSPVPLPPATAPSPPSPSAATSPAPFRPAPSTRSTSPATFPATSTSSTASASSPSAPLCSPAASSRPAGSPT